MITIQSIDDQTETRYFDGPWLDAGNLSKVAVMTALATVNAVPFGGHPKGCALLTGFELNPSANPMRIRYRWKVRNRPHNEILRPDGWFVYRDAKGRTLFPESHWGLILGIDETAIREPEPRANSS